MLALARGMRLQRRFALARRRAFVYDGCLWFVNMKEHPMSRTTAGAGAAGGEQAQFHQRRVRRWRHRARRSRTARRWTRACSAWYPRPARPRSMRRSKPRAPRCTVPGARSTMAERCRPAVRGGRTRSTGASTISSKPRSPTPASRASLASHMDIPRGAANFKIFADVGEERADRVLRDGDARTARRDQLCASACPRA